jgi:hypothetical protein
MKHFFRLPSVTVLLMLTSFALITNSCAKSNADSSSMQSRSPTEMEFRFEDYDYKSPETAQAKLTQLFPKGSSLEMFRESMEQLGAECYDTSQTKEVDGSMYCHYMEGKNFVKTKWVVGVKTSKDNAIEELTVKTGLIGP